MDFKRAIVDLMPAPLVRTFASPYIAGKGIASGVAKADQLHGHGLSSTIDLLGEEVFSREEVEATVQVYFRMIEALKDRPFATISLKPTQLGINESVEYCQANLRRIAAAAAVHGLRITLDMEDSSFTDRTLQMFKAVRDDFDNFGIVLQSRLELRRGSPVQILQNPVVGQDLRLIVRENDAQETTAVARAFAGLENPPRRRAAMVSVGDVQRGHGGEFLGNQCDFVQVADRP